MKCFSAFTIICPLCTEGFTIKHYRFIMYGFRSKLVCLSMLACLNKLVFATDN